MIEAPEAVCLSRQLNDAVCGKYISEVVVFHSPHKFTFISPGIDYEGVLLGKRVGKARARGGMVELAVGERALLFSDGANLTYLEPGADLPDKHQLLIGFGDESCLVVSVRMYGGVWCFSQGEFPGPLEPYYRSAKEKPQVLSDAFDLSYFMSLLDEPSAQKKSAKAFLATGQTIPGLGNGVLQDILYRAGMHPKTKISGLTRQQKERLFRVRPGDAPGDAASGRPRLGNRSVRPSRRIPSPFVQKYGRGAVSPLRFPDLQGKLPGGQYLLLSRLPAAMIRREGKYGDMTIRECSDGLRNHAKRTVVDRAFFLFVAGILHHGYRNCRRMYGKALPCTELPDNRDGTVIPFSAASLFCARPVYLIHYFEMPFRLDRVDVADRDQDAGLFDLAEIGVFDGAEHPHRR